MPIYNYSDYIKVMRRLPPSWPKDIFGIPVIKKQSLPISLIGTSLFLTGLNNVSKRDKNSKNKIIHSFSFDSKLEEVYKNPTKFLCKSAQYFGYATPDFSMHEGMEEWQIIHSVAKSRWMGAYMQSFGRRVYATVGWVDSSTYDICFAGLEDGSTFFISTLGVNNDVCKDAFLDGLTELERRFPKSNIVCLGQRIEGMPSDICMVPYNESFGNQIHEDGSFQGRLFNWDFTKEDC